MLVAVPRPQIADTAMSIHSCLKIAFISALI